MQETETTFGVWLRQQRRQLDLTQTELAARVGYSVVTIRKVERGELRPSKQLAERLAQQLNVTVTHRASTVALARSPSSHPAPADPLPFPSHVPSNLAPQLTPFFGRAAELLELTQLLTDPDCRLLTVVGPGGIGKTRLVIEVAQTLVQSAPHGICFVALAPLRASEHIVPAIADALHFRFQADNRLPKAQLLDYLRHKQLLLVLDNFEHLSDGIDLLPELLQNCPGLRLLVTSRERLQLSSETVFVLDSLEFPSGPRPHAALDSSAVQLFVATARRTRPTFVLDATNEQAVIRICQLVGGIPLAIILAAAWVKLLSPAEIVTELGQGFDLLETELHDLPARHHSMRAVLAQSWQRLTALEQAVFRRLAVFRGGFTRSAAQSVAGASLRLFSSLVNQSLIQRDAHGRYTLHELLRQYAETELETADQTAATRTAHCRYYTEYLQQREADLKGRRQVAALDEIEADFENVRAAWQWAVQQREFTLLAQAIHALFLFCEIRGNCCEGVILFSAASDELSAALVASATDQPTLQLLWAQVQVRLGACEEMLGNYERGEQHLQDGLQHITLDWERAFTLAHLGVTSFQRGELSLARTHLYKSLAISEQCNDEVGIANALQYLQAGEADYAKAAHLCAESLALWRKVGRPDRIANMLNHLGWHTCCLGDYAKANSYWQEGIVLCGQLGLPNEKAEVLGCLGFSAWCQGEMTTAERYNQEALAIYTALGRQSAIGLSMAELAVVLSSIGHVERAVVLARQAVAITRKIDSQMILTLSLNCLGAVLIAAGDFVEARHTLLEAIRRAWNYKYFDNLMAAFYYFAQLLVWESNAVELPMIADHRRFALDLLGCVRTQSATAQIFKDKAAQLQTQIEGALSAEMLATAIQCGQSCTLEEMVNSPFFLSDCL